MTRVTSSGALASVLTLLAVSSFFSTTGCDLAAGLTDVGGSLANPDAALLDSPGRKLASGVYHRLLIDGTLKDGGHVIAVRTDRSQDELAVVPYLEGAPCFVKPAINADRLSSKIDVELSGVITVQRDATEDGRGKVSFVNFDCEEVYDSLEGSTLPQNIFPFSQPRGLLAATREGELSLVNVKSGKIEPISSEVSAARTSGDTLWTVEGGQLVARNASLDEVMREGSEVSDFVVPGGSRLEAAYVDSEGLHVWNQNDGSKLISTTACLPVAWGTDAIAFADPCESNTLGGYTTGARLGIASEFVKVNGPKDVVMASRSLTFWGQGQRATELVFLTQGPEETEPRLILGRIEKGAELDEEGSVTLETTVLSEDSPIIQGGNIYINWDGTSGTLVELERNEKNETTGLVEVAAAVAQILGASAYSEAGVLTDFADGLGTLERLSGTAPDLTRTVLAEGVPIQNHAVEESTKLRAFIADSENGVTGTLYLMPKSSSPGVPSKPQAIDDDVYLDTARFLDQPRAVAYLTRAPGEEFAQLKVWLIEPELVLTVHKKVSEYRTVPWPAPGILYAVPDGKDQGLWFSKAR